jgi:hypothetical protein
VGQHLDRAVDEVVARADRARVPSGRGIPAKRAETLPWKVAIWAGPKPLVCWLKKPIHIGDWGLMRPA